MAAMIPTLSTSLEPLFLCASPFGLSPFAIRNNMVVSRFGCALYSLAAFLLITSLYIYVFALEPVSDMYSHDRSADSPFIEEATDSLEAFCSALASSVCILRNFLNRRKIAAIVNRLQWFDQSLRKHHPTILRPDTGLTRVARNIYLRTVVTFLCSWSWVLASAAFEALNYPDETTLQWAMYTLPIGVTTHLTLQFVVVATALQRRFRALNECLERKRNASQMVEYAASAHAYLCAIVNVLKDAYRDQILAVMMQSSVTIVASTFFMGNELLHRTNESTSGYTYAYTALMFAYCSSQMISVVCVSVRLSFEVRKTVRVMFGHAVDFNTDNSSRMLFAYQTLHDSGEFELCRGFPVDGSLLSNVSQCYDAPHRQRNMNKHNLTYFPTWTQLVGTVTTYLLIVIQFEVNLME